MKVDDIRKLYLEYFEKNGHRVVSSDSLIPQNDPTLLFTGAGMNQFKEYFLGLKKDMTRATSSQKCIRTGDLENVGQTAYHHSFFEMLGNFSFGDYFKEDAIKWAWDFFTNVLKLPTDKLRVTVHHSDDEAYTIWKDQIKVREDWIYKLGDDSNFWPANAPKDGPNGPCGPCSEIYYDIGMENLKEGQDPEDIESSRFAEIWNLVFTQYDRQSDGSLEPLANKNIDTGMGLERLACVLQGKKNNFDIDVFEPIHAAIEESLGVKRDDSNKSSMNAIADHVRAIVFSMADGVIPSNEGRGYVIRKIIRRSLWHAHQVSPQKKIDSPFLYTVVPAVVKTMGAGYPELADVSKSIEATLKGEEERFLETLETGMKILNQKLQGLEGKGQKSIPGEDVFELYDTYGFPDELTRVIANERGFDIDQKGFDQEMAKQKQRAKDASQISDNIFVTSELEQQILALPDTEFLGYVATESESSVLFVSHQEGKGVVVLDKTPFYAESGGQVGDVGVLTIGSNSVTVKDTQKKGNVFMHFVDESGAGLKVGDKVQASVDKEVRNNIMRNHTATHLLHAALRKKFGDQVRQRGSLVTATYFRFDYSYGKALTDDEVAELQTMVTEEIKKNTTVVKEEKTMDEAKESGAIAFFGEKYGDTVRIVDIPGFSKEFCGGTHCENTQDIQYFWIKSDSSIASGTRRIEAFTGSGVETYAKELEEQLGAVKGRIDELQAKLPESKLFEGAEVAKDGEVDVYLRGLTLGLKEAEEFERKLKSQIKKAEKSKQAAASTKVDAKALVAEAVVAGDYKIIVHPEEGVQVPALRQISDTLKNEAENSVYILLGLNGEKLNYILGTSKDIASGNADMRQLSKELESLLGGKGGGRKDLVQGGGRLEGSLEEKCKAIEATTADYVQRVE